VKDRTEGESQKPHCLNHRRQRLETRHSCFSIFLGNCRELECFLPPQVFLELGCHLSLGLTVKDADFKKEALKGKPLALLGKAFQVLQKEEWCLQSGEQLLTQALQDSSIN